MSADPAAPPAPARKGQPLLAWLVIVGVVAFIVWRNQEPRPAGSGSTDVFVLEMQARYMVGAASLVPGQGKALYEQEKTLLDRAGGFQRSSFGQRLRSAILAGELAGPEEALQQLKRLEDEAASGMVSPATPEQERASAVLRRLYQDYQQGKGPDALPPAERAELHDQLGWFGDLALAPVDRADPAQRERVLAPARRTVWVVAGYFVAMILLGGLGLVLGIVLLVLWLLSRLRAGVRPGSPYGGVYAETFALYLLLFVAASLALGRLGVPEHLRIFFLGLVALGGLAALFWPVLRGVPWRQVRADLGWTPGGGTGREVALGVGCYVTALPLVLMGLLVYLLASYLQRRLGMDVEPPNHPLVGWVARSGWWVRLQIAFDACVVAPLVEETMFRGVLYRHLREATGRWWPALSVLTSAVVVSVIFAMIHPQGLLFVPVLGALAFTFCLARQWRGSLLAPMVAHGINNAVALVLLLLMIG
jgi:membrane protease YdiL (CAAX protease family)